MMTHYIDIDILQDAEMNSNVLMNTLFAKVHLQLAKGEQSNIGVSFPNFKKTLGDMLRLHGDKDSLQAILASNMMAGLKDYTKTTAVKQAPAHCQYRTVERVQVKSSLERLYRRSVKAGKVTEEDALVKIQTGTNKMLKLPYLQVVSKSTGQSFRLFVKHGQIQGNETAGAFTKYGLSSTATIPWF